MRARWVVATGNRHKVEEMRAILAPSGIGLVTPAETGLQLDPDEWGSTFATNAAIKAIAWAHATGLTALADDSGLEVDALEGRPGVHSSRYAGVGATDSANVERLLSELDGVPTEHRSARFRCVVALVVPRPREDDEPQAAALADLPASGRYCVDGRWIVRLASGSLEGRIAFAPKGSGGFGYDPVFLLPEGRHLSELASSEKNAISHRGRALEALLAALR
jgi:XTP/dITP diphosphohydrolase